VTNANTGAPIAGVWVGVATVGGNVEFIETTDASGVYSIAVPPGALYYVVTSSAQGYLPGAFPDVRCLFSFCSSTDLREAEPFSIAAGASITGRNFELTPGGSISGTVTNAAGAGVANVTVTALVRIGTQTFSTFANTNAAGAYTITGLNAGSYYLVTSNSQGLRNEIYDNIPCVLGCLFSVALATGTPVPVSPGTPATGRNFSLETGGSISGVITNATTGQPLQNVGVAASARVGTNVVSSGSVATNANGEYTITGLAAATYSVFTNSGNTTNEIYPDLLCPELL
jgi:hypothetical protein